MNAGLNENEIETFVQQAAGAVGQQLAGLREVEQAARQRLATADIEQRQLDQLLEEVAYHRQFAGSGTPDESDPLARYLQGIGKREAELRRRSDQLQEARARLARLGSRLELLIRQIEASGAYLLQSEHATQAEDPLEAAMRMRLLQGQEAERARLAREVHDGPAQVLTHMIMGLDFVEQMLRTRPADAPAELMRLKLATRESLRETRRFIFNLRPASLSEAGLIPTLHSFIADFKEQSGLEVELNVVDPGKLSPDEELTIFRTLQEGLRNINKHAVAKHVLIELGREPEGLLLTVRDDGVGFDSSKGSSSGSGLVSMKERAELLGARLTISSQPGHGTELRLLLTTADQPPPHTGRRKSK